jgi:hypothetical protein
MESEADGDGASPAAAFVFDTAQAQRFLAAAASRDLHAGATAGRNLSPAMTGQDPSRAGESASGDPSQPRAGHTASGRKRAGVAAAAVLARVGQAAAAGLPRTGQASAAPGLPRAGQTASTGLYARQTATGRPPLRAGQAGATIDATRTLRLKRRTTAAAPSDIAYSPDPSSPVTPQSDPTTWYLLNSSLCLASVIVPEHMLVCVTV